MEIVWGRVLPVIVSIVIIILIAILREYSRTLAAILVTMPVNIPLGLWIVYNSSDNQAATEQFTQAIFVNIWPTIVFLLVVWMAARAGWHFAPMIIAGYVAWAIALGIVSLIRGV